MSEFSCPLVQIESVEDHPNADRLSLVRMNNLGYLAITNKLDDGSHRYKPGDVACYIPSASILPDNILIKLNMWNSETNKGILAGSDGNRVKPLKLRGIFSEGLLYPITIENLLNTTKVDHTVNCARILIDDKDAVLVSNVTSNNNWSVQHFVGTNLANHLNIVKYEPPVPFGMAGEVASVTRTIFNYDFERYESATDILSDSDTIVAVEKVHGTFCCIQLLPNLNHSEMFGKTGDVTVSSKGLGKLGLAMKNNANNTHNVYVRALQQLLDNGFEDAVANAAALILPDVNPSIAICGEIFGNKIQDLTYGMASTSFAVFDVKINNVWLTRSQAEVFCAALAIPMLPVLYTGPFDLAAITAVRDGKTTIGGNHVREGVVVTSTNITPHPLYGRRICKFISPDYLLRKVKGGEPTEYV